MSLRIIRNEGETWRDCAERYAKPWGLQVEVMEALDSYVSAGVPEYKAALWACIEWDVADLKPSTQDPTTLNIGGGER